MSRTNTKGSVDAARLAGEVYKTTLQIAAAILDVGYICPTVLAGGECIHQGEYGCAADLMRRLADGTTFPGSPLIEAGLWA